MNKQNKKSEVRKTLDERDALYGGFENVAETSQILKDVAREHDNYGHLNAVHREALEMINHKIARIINGNPNYKDNWIDIAGYATLVADTLG